MKNKLISFVLSLVMVLGCATCAFGATLSDVANTSHEEAIESLTGLGLIKGYTDGSFGPEDPVTRAQMAAFIVRALGFNPNYESATKFKDVSADHWASGYIAFAADLGIINGYTNGNFGPNDNVTYEQAVAMIVRALGYNEDYLTFNYPNAKYPGKYLLVAAQLNMSEKLDSTAIGSLMNRANVAQILYNVMDEQIHSYNRYGIDTAKVGECFLSRQNLSNKAQVVAFTENTSVNTIEYVGQYANVYSDKNGKIVSIVPTSAQITGKFNSNGKFIADGGSFLLEFNNKEVIENESKPEQQIRDESN